MPISRGLRALLGVFGPMVSAAQTGGRGVVNMWQAYTAAYQRQGLERPPATLADMNTFRQWLGTVARGSATLGRAADTDALVGDMLHSPLGYQPNARDAAAPSMLVTFQAFVDTPNGPVERWSSLSYNVVLPATVGELRADMTGTLQQAMDLAAMEGGGDSPTAGGTVAGLGDVFISARGF